MNIVITVGELKDKVDWLKVCDLKGWNEWILADGLIDSTDEITLTEAEAYALGLSIQPKKLPVAIVRLTQEGPEESFS